MVPRYNLSDLSEGQIQSILSRQPDEVNFQPVDPGFNFPPEMRLRSAAVLIPFLRGEKGWEILFTRRTDLVQDHKGQVSFPGGGEEPADANPGETALREAWEEIGLPPSDVRLLGHLEPMMSRFGYRITPVVGVIPWPFPMRLSEAEVSRVFTIPLSWLADPGNYEERFYRADEVIRNVPVVFYKPFDGELLWGISARITVSLVDLLKQNRSQE